MFRSVSRRLALRTSAPLLQATLPDGFSYVKANAVEDKDLTSPYEAKDALNLTLTRQDAFIYKLHAVKGVQLSTESGDLGVLPGHEYKIAKIKPSVITIELTDGTTEKYFTSGGFAHINNEGSCDVNTVECVPVEDLDKDRIEKEIAHLHSEVSSAKDEKSKSVFEIQLELLEAAKAALSAH